MHSYIEADIINMLSQAFQETQILWSFSLDVVGFPSNEMIN